MYRANVPSETDPATALQTIRLIVGAMSFGLVVVTAVFAFLGPKSELDGPSSTVWLSIVAAAALSSATIWIVFRKVALASLRRQEAAAPSSSPDQALVQPYTNRLLVGAALSEGPGLLSALVYFVTGNLIALAGVVVALYALSRFFPSDRRYRRFVQSVTGTSTELA